jgi:hypothetical protein
VDGIVHQQVLRHEDDHVVNGFDYLGFIVSQPEQTLLTFDSPGSVRLTELHKLAQYIFFEEVLQTRASRTVA